MNTTTKSRSRSLPLVQPLERRRLLSGSWTTVDTDPTSYNLEAMAADNIGNVYALGIDNNNIDHLRQETGGVWSTVTVASAATFSDVATDAAGDVFISGSSSGGATIWERPAGQSEFAVIDSMSNAGYSGLATDAAGDVFVAGMQSITTTVKNRTTTTRNGIVRKLVPTGGGSFAATTSVLSTSLGLGNISVVGSGAAAGVYAIGASGTSSSPNSWAVFKSANGTGSWSLVDQFRYNPSYGSDAYAVAADGTGNVYVCGVGGTADITSTARNGKPLYSRRNHWLVRESGNGNSGSWSTVNDYLPSGATEAYATAMGTDLAGNMYVVGSAGAHAVIRTNAGGDWSTSDDYSVANMRQPAYTAFTVDSNGTLYAGCEDWVDATNTVVRSMAGPRPTSTTATPSLFSSTSIAGDYQTVGNHTLDELLAT